MANTRPTLDRGAAVTRSLLGWGVVAGPFYLLVGVILGSTRPGFDFTRHALSQLMLGQSGWIQRANFVLTGIMVIAAGTGMLRAIRSGRGLAIGAPVVAAGLALVSGAVFVPDAVNDFPPGTATDDPTTSGILHLLCGAVQFVAIVVAASAYARWNSTRGRSGRAAVSAVLAAGILGGFAAGVALAQHPTGIALIWLAVLCEWIWLATASIQIYQWSPHPLGEAGR
ncbi:DUF998 domain-containing protein [Mycobacterium sp. 236(2023)]|uniref:DUF998 domain-containing protein n=1 Tax=Mycobacterium sp. 236(2023) TaxID=3038163 RepID=UPI002415618F|nr:DUF998 domain-containing protein [Mycobacterium sp. 236(2023)]MDG4662970.1 DUF998 domain-containing protein [Mycobacterium sp. 236(2023)]